ncbi:MAG: Flp pilus assembly complex ATPase component TadA [Lentisphaerae bacterium]|nr:Flp pilus assembly complex ATPase component TadA [Lentisphaerota bacterium]
MNATRATSHTTGDAPAYVQALLSRALDAGLTDLYLIPDRDGLDLSGRQASGARVALDRLPAPFGAQCVARLKVLAGMLTYRTSTAQDGAIHGIDGHPHAELRLATLPTCAGERVTVRIVQGQARPPGLDDLGFAAPAVAAIRRLLQHPAGIVILTGPTGSGKTTTIYAMVRDLLARGHSPATLITIEDPVESALEGISQVELRRDDPAWGYAEALRAVLRHDVKTLVIGELRDREVTRVALDAALTGHRVITTYHAGDIGGVYARLLHQGFEPFQVAAAVTGVVAQRLLRGRADGAPVPVAAVLEADDAWREVVMAAPGLGDLRRRAGAVPGADLEAAARDLAAAGRIDAKEAILL